MVKRERRCILCGLVLPPRRWWQPKPPPFHNPNGADAALCWRGLCQRIGISTLTPMPPVDRGRVRDVRF